MPTTVLFDFDVRTMNVSPFKVDTPFGRPVAVSIDDTFAQADELERRVHDLIDALRVIYVIADNHEPGPDDTTLADIIAACEEALGEDLR